MERPPPRDVDVDEVLPPERGKDKAGADATKAAESNEAARIMAYWLDEFIRIPGTKIRIGLDPILAFFPMVGDFLASSLGSVILIEAVRVGISLPVLLRMGLNMLINTVLDLIPVVGPGFSAFFRSNSRNLHLLREWQAGNQAAVKKGTWRLFLFVGLIFLFVIALWIGMWSFYFWMLTRLFSWQ